MAWEHETTIVISTRGTRAEILAGQGRERTFLTFPKHVPKLTPAELERADALMREHDAKTRTESEAA